MGLPVGRPSTVGERVSGPAPAADAPRADSWHSDVPFNGQVPVQTAGGTYAWIGQGAPTPVTKSDFASVTVAGAKAGGIVVLTEELVEAARESPSALAVMREEMINGVGSNFLMGSLIDPAIAAVADVSPGQHHERRGDVGVGGHVSSECGDGFKR